MLRNILTSRPFQVANAVIDLIQHYWVAWRAHCRARMWFPNSRDLGLSLSTVFKYRMNIVIGDCVRIGPGAVIGARSRVVIEDHVRISQGAIVETAGLDLKKGYPYEHVSRAITIKQGAWIGAGAIVLGGVTIGENALIGAGTVISRDVPSGAVIVGPACREIKSL